MKSGKEFLNRINTRNVEPARIAKEYDTKSWLGRLMMRRSNPQLERYLEFRDAEQSIVDSQLAIARHEAEEDERNGLDILISDSA